MTAVLLIPPIFQFNDNNGDPLANGFVYTYAAGTTTPKDTYTDYTGGTPAPNPIQLNSAGRPTSGSNAIWGSGAYKFIVKDSSGAQVGDPLDNVSSFNTASGLSVLGTIAANTLVGNNTGSATTPTALTVAQVLTMLSGSLQTGFKNFILL
jgi:hypothetical protein